MAQRNLIEGKFGQGKSAYGLQKIKARLKDTSEIWIMSIYFVMNLLRLTQDSFFGFIKNWLYALWVMIEQPTILQFLHSRSDCFAEYPILSSKK